MASLGIDIGSVSTKAVVIDEDNKILASDYIWTQGSPVSAVKTILSSLTSQSCLPDIFSVGVTGSARKLIGSMLDADSVKNEITAHAMGTLSRFPKVRTILEIGGQDSKIIIVENAVVKDYAMNTLCAAGTGAFLSSQSKRLGLAVEELGDIALASEKPAKITARCTVFAESDMIHKAQMGYEKSDLVAGLCQAVVANYLNNVGKGKTIEAPIVFQGGVSKNPGVVKAFEDALNQKVFVDNDSHLMGALGAAILSRGKKRAQPFSFELADCSYESSTSFCKLCPNQCEILCFYRDGQLLDSWGNRCEKGKISIVNTAITAGRI